MSNVQHVGMLIREETAGDVEAVARVHESAFGDHAAKVNALTAALRDGLAEDGGLSLVALVDCTVVGHVLLSTNLLDTRIRNVSVQVLSPLGVVRDQQGRGIGTELVNRGVMMLGERGVPAVFLEGDPRYYTRLGFRPAAELGFRKPSLRIPDPAFMVHLLPAYEPWMTGTLVYRQAFWTHDAVGLRDGDDRSPGADSSATQLKE
jgi:putative acetyltransferase